MKTALIVVGLILLGLGVWVTVGNVSYRDTDTKAKIGPVKVQTASQEPVPASWGYAGIAVGGLLIILGITKQPR